jgi:hypothetical protein
MKTGKGVRKGSCLSLVPFTLRSKCLTKKVLEESEDFKIGEQWIWTVKYAHDLVLLVTEETVLQGMTKTLIEIGRDY